MCAARLRPALDACDAYRIKPIIINREERFLLTPALAVLIFLSTSSYAQSGSPASQELKASATLTEALNWLNQAITTYAAVGVYKKEDGKIVSGMSFF
jgi:hypothetical protein